MKNGVGEGKGVKVTFPPLLPLPHCSFLLTLKGNTNAGLDFCQNVPCIYDFKNHFMIIIILVSRPCCEVGALFGIKKQLIWPDV